MTEVPLPQANFPTPQIGIIPLVMIIMMANLRTEVEFQIKDKIMREGKTTSIHTDLVRIDLMVGLDMFLWETKVLTFN